MGAVNCGVELHGWAGARSQGCATQPTSAVAEETCCHMLGGWSLTRPETLGVTHPLAVPRASDLLRSLRHPYG